MISYYTYYCSIKSPKNIEEWCPNVPLASLLQSSRSNCQYNYILLQLYGGGGIGFSQLSILFYFQYLFRLNKDGLSRGRLSTYLNVRYMCQNIGSVFHPIEFSIFKYLVTQLLMQSVDKIHKLWGVSFSVKNRYHFKFFVPS